ncbi:MAG: hypothetical protein H7A48_13890 [Akkermansiaceae bacterium]|nr:hypothetical protein [Akkermansiaceae bacterium]MCP5547364.1 hypothetical protein [Akkermansiaceae bacterium]
MSTRTKTCEECGASFEFEATGMLSMVPIFCGQCSEKFTREADEAEALRKAEAERERQRARDEAIEREADRAERFVDSITPARFLDTRLDHPDFNRPLWERVNAWRATDERPWLGLVGETGGSKTRCAFLRLRLEPRIYIDEYISAESPVPRIPIAVTSGPAIGRLVVDRASRDEDRAESARRALEDIRNSWFLLIDELGKLRSTSATIAEAFDILDHRHAENLDTIWTSNTAPRSFCQTWPAEYAGPACGRILDCSTIFTA